MSLEKDFKTLLGAAKKLLSERYRDGEVDAVSLSNFEDVVESLNGSPCCLDPANHMEEPGDELFLPRKGCLVCDEWFSEPEMRETPLRRNP